MSNKINIAELFNGLQNQMVAQLNTNREFILHPGSKGDSLENVWIEWLKKYLPNRYCVDKAIIIDSNGELSHQIDLVIYDQQYTPFVFTQNGIHYIPAEGVYAVFEVKPDFQGNVGEDNFFQYAGKKIESVRKLKRTSVKIINAGSEYPARPLTKIIGGILASTNSYTHANNNTIESHVKSLTGLQSIEMGCAVDYGSFYVNYDGQEDVGNKNYEERISNYYSARKFENMTFSAKENSLVTFFLQLTRYLQQSIGTVAAIDLNAYAKSVGFEIDEKYNKMNKATKYALNGAGIGGLGGIIFSVIKQLSEMNDNPNQKFDWGKMFETGLKGAAIGGATGLAMGAVTDYQNKNEEPINTDAFLYTVVNNVKLNKNDEQYKRLCNKADFLTDLLSNKYTDKLSSSPVRLGSTEKGTALRDKFDIDIFFSFKSNSFTSTEEMFLSMLDFLEEQVDRNGIIKVRNQKKSIGVIFEIKGEEYKIDIVPCKITQSDTGNTSGYLYLNDISLLGKSSYTKTDITAIKSIKLTEMQKKIVIILKHWKKKNDLPISSHLLENYVLDAYSYYKYKIPKTITKKVIMVLEHIKESIDSNVIRSIENTNNVLTNISDNSKQQIIYACKNAIEDYEYQPNSVVEIFS